MSNIVVPQLGESVVEARVARWLKKEGDRVETGEPVVELETEKIDLEVGADHGGVLASIERREGEDVKVGELLGVVDESGAAAPEAGNGSGAAAARRSQPEDAAAAPKTAKPPAQSSPEPRATPTARRVARDHDVNIGTLTGSGPGGRITKQDVQKAMAPASEGPRAPTGDRRAAPARQRDAAPAPDRAAAPARAGRSERTEERVRMSKRRATIARRLVEAQHAAAMLTTFNEVDMTEVMALRERRKAAFKEQYGVGLGITSFFVKAAVAALRAFPRLNAEIQGDEIVMKHYYDLGIAVGAEGGLVVPVLRDADRMSFADIELGIRDFSTRAGDGTLTLEDLTGGTFTITNGGVFGSLLSTPILNPPQVGILGLHKIQERAVSVGGQVAVRPMMYLALTYDHRIVDGREAVQFLVALKDLVEDPGNLLVVS